jgi:CheY-like chemotaxis protein
MPTHASILLIEDSPGECELFRLALEQTGLAAELFVEHDAEAALHFLTRRVGHHPRAIQAGSSQPQGGDGDRSPPARVERGPFEAPPAASTGAPSGLPSLILLDWHLQHTRGDRFLVRLRSDARVASIPVVLFTTSADTADMNAGYGCGANSYVVKPSTFDELVLFTHDLCGYWLQWNRTTYQIASQC